MTRSVPEALFLDYDGVLCDSVHVKTDAFVQLYAAEGRIIQDRVKAFHLDNGGMSRYLKFRHFEQELLGRSPTEVDIEALSEQFADLVVRKVVASREIAGAGTLLRRAKDSSVAMHVISGTPEEELRNIVERRGEAGFFETVNGSPTTKSDHVNRLIRDYGYAPTGVVFLGDARQDYEAAEAGGVRFLGIVGEGVGSSFPPGTPSFADLRGVPDYLGLC